MAPALQQRARLPVLEHSGRAHDHHGVVLLAVDPGVLLEVVDVPVLEGVGFFLVEPLAYLLAEHVDVGLVDVAALVDEGDRVVDLYVVELVRLLLPVLVQDEQQLLCAPRRKDRQQALPPALHDLMHVLLELLLAHPPALVHPDPERALGDEDVHVGLRDLRLHDVSVLLATVVARVEDLHAIDLDDEHGGAYDVSGHVGRDLDALLLGLHSELYGVNPLQTVEYLLGVEERAVFLHLGGVPNEIVVDILGGLGHVNLLPVAVIGEEVGQRAAVIEVGVRDEDHGQFFGVDVAEEGQAVGVLLVDHQPAVQHDLLAVDGQDEARPAHLAPRAQRQDRHLLHSINK